MVGLPVSVSMPRWASKEQLLGGAEVAGGLIFGDYVAATIVSATGQTGAPALAVGMGTKLALGFSLFYAASKTGGSLAPVLGMVAVGTTASVVIDAIRYAWPRISTPSASLGAAYKGMRLAAPAVTLAPAPLGPPAGIRLRAETPEAYALGGF